MRFKIAHDQVAYLKSPVKQYGLVALLNISGIYLFLTNPAPYPYSIYVTLLLGLIIVGLLGHRPRWIIYLLSFLAITIHLYSYIHIVANGEQDPYSTRDMAVEVTAQAFMRAENAWNVDPGVQVSTGPTSILIALPFVRIFNQINWLTFLFWVLFFLVLLKYDVKNQNNTWLILILISLLGWLDIEHTLYWSLEELYYPILYLAFAYLLVENKRWFWTGILLAAAVLTRVNYIFLVIGFIGWYICSDDFNWKQSLKMDSGFLVGFILILLPFIIIGGQDLISNNPWQFALSFSEADYPASNIIFRALNRISNLIGSGLMQVVKLGLSLLFMAGVTWILRRLKITHPFWHITAAAFIAHTLVWLPAHLPKDYTLMIVLPAMIAVALTPEQISPGNPTPGG